MRRALERLLSSEHSEENVLYYLDVEALVAFHNPDLRYVEVVRRTLEQLLEYGGLTRAASAVEDAVEDLLCPVVMPDVLPALSSLEALGYEVVLWCPVDQATFSARIRPRLPERVASLATVACDVGYALGIARAGPLFERLAETCGTLCPGTSAPQVLVVTTGHFRTIEPAHEAGFPTAFLLRDRVTESRFNLDTSMPNFASGSLVELVEQLSLHRSDPSLEFLENLPAPVAERTEHGDDVRYAGLYKYLGELGSGSFGMAAHRS